MLFPMLGSSILLQKQTPRPLSHPLLRLLALKLSPPPSGSDATGSGLTDVQRQQQLQHMHLQQQAQQLQQQQQAIAQQQAQLQQQIQTESQPAMNDGVTGKERAPPAHLPQKPKCPKLQTTATRVPNKPPSAYFLFLF